MIPQKKEIVYTSHRRIAVIVAEGEYKGVKYVCVNRGIHPCAYVFCTQEFLDKHATEYETIDGIYVHGGISYIGNANELLGLEDYDHPCFGWRAMQPRRTRKHAVALRLSRCGNRIHLIPGGRSLRKFRWCSNRSYHVGSCFGNLRRRCIYHQIPWQKE